MSSRRKRSIPFHVTLLSLMALIVFPLASALLWLGWRAVDQLEDRSIAHRMAALDAAVQDFLTSGLDVVVAVGTTLAQSQGFAPDSTIDDAERLRQLIGIMGLHPTMAATYVGYDNGRFLFVGESEVLSVEQRLKFDAPDAPCLLVRVIEAGDGPRQETWWFRLDDGRDTPRQTRLETYDPRTRPWFIEAMAAKGPVLTEPYTFAQAHVVGVSTGVPLQRGGVIGFDFTLDTLSKLLSEYRFTPNSLIMVAGEGGAVFMESEPCRDSPAGCLPGENAVRAAMKKAIAEAVGGKAVERDVRMGDRDYRLMVHLMPPAFGRRYMVGAAVPIVELSTDSQLLIERAAIAATVAVLLATLGGLLASLVLSRSIARIAAKTERIRDLDFGDRAPVESRITEIVRLSESVEHMREGLEVFGRYVSKNLVHQILRSPGSAGVGGTRREISVMFTDIEGFSRLSETMEPELLTSRLSRYFDALGKAILTNRGTIDKYIGDGIMAFWNAPETDPDHVANACRGALQAAAASRNLARKWEERGRPGFRTRIGLHTGPAVVGNVGAREHINYTLVGAVANQASRLEGLNKAYRTEVLASGEVAAKTAGRFVWRHVDRVVAAGTTEVHDIHEPMGEIETLPHHADFLERWTSARGAYVAGRFEEALAAFRAAAELRPQDGPCAVFIARCLALVGEGRSARWDGTWHFDKK